MKKIMMTLAAVLCCAMTMILTSCSQNDNPSEPATQSVKMADVVTLTTAPQSLYKLDTKELLPIYIAVNSAYKDGKGETQFYDLSKIKEVKTNSDMFDLDTSNLARYGYIKLTPNPEADGTKSLIKAVEDYGALEWSSGITISLTNKLGEKLVKVLQLTYLPKNEQKEVLNIKQSDLNENNELILEPAVIEQYGFSEWPINRKADFIKSDLEGFFDAKITEDGKLVLTTDGYTTTSDDPDKLTLVFTRNLTGSPSPLLPEGEGLMVNFRYELELNISE